MNFDGSEQVSIRQHFSARAPPEHVKQLPYEAYTHKETPLLLRSGMPRKSD